MGLISIDENTLNDIADALREVNGTQQTYTIKNMADGVYMIDAVDDWTWVEDKGRTRMHIDVWDKTRLTVTINARLVGMVDWGDGSEIESYIDESVTLHTHTYDTIGKYVISLEGDVVQLGDTCANGDAVCQRYLYQLECGKNCSFSANSIKQMPNLSRVYFSSYISSIDLNFSSTRIRAMYFNGQTVTIPGYGFNSNYWMIELKGTATINGGTANNGLYYFRNGDTTILNMSDIVISIDVTSGRGRYFGPDGGVCPILHFGNLRGSTSEISSRGMPTCVSGTYYWINMPANCPKWSESTSKITIAANGELHCYNPTPPTILSDTVTMNPGAKIYVPTGSLEAYQTATNWSALADYMEEE